MSKTVNCWTTEDTRTAVKRWACLCEDDPMLNKPISCQLQLLFQADPTHYLLLFSKTWLWHLFLKESDNRARNTRLQWGGIITSPWLCRGRHLSCVCWRKEESAHAVGQGICRCLDTEQAEPLPSAQQILMGCGRLSEGTSGALGLPHCPCLRDTVKQEDDRQLAKKLISKPTCIYRVNFNDQGFPFCHFSFSAKLKGCLC